MILAKFRRSPFLFSYWNEENKLVLYNYNMQTKAIVSKDIMRILDVLPDWKDLRQLSKETAIDGKDLSNVLDNLIKLKIICKNNQRNQENNFSNKSIWDPIDLAMQRQRSYGGRFEISERVGTSPSPIKNVSGISSVMLTKPKKETQSRLSLKHVLENRKSIRSYSSKHITFDNLSYFLYHTARIKSVFNSKEGTLTERPYPSGGARYPLEIYASNNRITEIQKGIHYYDPLKHKLVLLNKNKNYQKRFNQFVKRVLYPNLKRDPDVIFIITAVFARTMWKYDKLGLSLVLSDLGCLYQTMYLIATEMNLAPCPVGKIDEELVKNWIGLNWFEESHVGTFMLGVPE